MFVKSSYINSTGGECMPLKKLMTVIQYLIRSVNCSKRKLDLGTVDALQ
jgi:hypothetical protein